MRALLDTDVILDILLDREPFAEAASALWQANQHGDFEGYISAITPINVFYIARKLKGAEIARRAVTDLLAGLRVCTVDQMILQAAIALPLTDYEDAVQYASATANQVNVIVTRNVEDYKGTLIPVMLPLDFLNDLKKSNGENPT